MAKLVLLLSTVYYSVMRSYPSVLSDRRTVVVRHKSVQCRTVTPQLHTQGAFTSYVDKIFQPYVSFAPLWPSLPPPKNFFGPYPPPLGDQKEGWRAGLSASPSQPSFRGPDLFFEFSLKFYPPPGRPKRGLGGLGEGWPTGQPPPPYFRCLGRCPVTLRGSELRVIFYFDLTKTLVINWVK